MISVVHVKAADGRVEVQCPFPQVAAFNLVAGCAVDIAGAKIQQGIDDAGRQRTIDPVDRLAAPAVAIKCPGERCLSSEIFP